MLRQSNIRRRLAAIPISWLGLLFAVILGVAAWLLMDRVHVSTLDAILGDELSGRVERAADRALDRFSRLHFERMVVVRALAADPRLGGPVGAAGDGAGDSAAELPAWLVDAIQRAHPDDLTAARLVTRDGRAVALYQPLAWTAEMALPLAAEKVPPWSAMDSAILLRQGRAFLVLAAPVAGGTGGGAMRLEVFFPLSGQFEPWREDAEPDMRLALVDRVNGRSLLLAGASAADHGSYVVATRRLTDNGIALHVGLPRAQWEGLRARLLTKERQQRILGLSIVIAVFLLALMLFSSRIAELVRRVSKFSRRALGISQTVPSGGNQLLLLEDWMREFVRLVRDAREEMREKLETELRQTETLRDAIMNTSLDGIVTVDQAGRVLDFNPTAQKMLGFGLHEVLDRPLADILVPSARRAGLKRALDASLGRADANAGAKVVEELVVDKQGHECPVEIAIKPVALDRQTVFTVYIRDVAERKRREEEIRSLANFPSENPSPVLRVNRPGVVVYANPPSEPLLRYWGVRPGQTLPFYWKHKIQAALERRSNEEMEVNTEEGIFSLLLAPVSDAGYVSIYARDITDIRNAEMEVKQRQNELVHVSRLSTMGEMATGIAHELNQPLSAIVNFANGCIRRLRLDIGDKEDLMGALKQIGDQAGRASEIIKRLRGMIGRQQPVREVTDLNHLVRESALLLAHETRKNEVALESRLSYRALMVRVDPVQIEQALLNLMRNALDALQDVPSAGRRLIVGSGLRPNGMAYVTVRDTAGGIPGEIRAHLFDAFFTTKETGMGMGLAISQTIVEDHNGKIFADSTPGEGTTFTIELPLYAEQSESVAV